MLFLHLLEAIPRLPDYLRGYLGQLAAPKPQGIESNLNPYEA